jgi:hypothetical protein
MSPLDHIAIRILRRSIYDQLTVIGLIALAFAAGGALL